MARPSVEDIYLQHYGFTHDPFGTRTPGVKFFPARRKSVLAELHQHANQHGGLLLITGPQGSGKTLVRQALIATTPKHNVQNLLIAPQPREAGGILGRIANTLGCHCTPHAILIHAEQLALSGQSLHLLIDDAHQLDDEALLDLLSLTTKEADSRLSIFLFGESKLKERLTALSAGTYLHSISLQPYNESETQEYLAQRLESAGGQGNCFSPAQIRLIHQHSEGWPGRVNQVARAVLMHAVSAPQRTQKPTASVKKFLPIPWPLPIPKLHAIALLAALAVIGASVFWPVQEPSQEAETTANTEPHPSSSQEQGIDINGNGQRVPLPQNAEDEPLIRDPVAAAAGGESEQLAPLAPPVYAARKPATQQTPQHSAPIPPEKTKTSDSPKAKSSSTPTKPPTPASEHQAPAKKPKPPAAQATPSIKKQPELAKAPVLKRNTTAFTGWYRRQPSNQYTLQVLGTYSEPLAQNLTTRYSGACRYFAKPHQGKTLYIVTYGQFKDRPTALEAIPKLPAQLQIGPPWARSFASIQQILSAAL